MSRTQIMAEILADLRTGVERCLIQMKTIIIFYLTGRPSFLYKMKTDFKTIIQGDVDIMFPLGLLSAGEQAQIVSIRENPQGKCECRVEDMGLRIGKTVEMLTNGGGGAILLKVDESRLAIGRGMAMKIIVRRS